MSYLIHWGRSAGKSTPPEQQITDPDRIMRPIVLLIILTSMLAALLIPPAHAQSDPYEVGSPKFYWGTKSGAGVLKVSTPGCRWIQIQWISGTVTLTDADGNSLTLDSASPSLVLSDLPQGDVTITETGTGTWRYIAVGRPGTTCTRP